MNLLVRAVVMGFGMAAGAALYKRLAEDLGVDKKPAGQEPTPASSPPVDPDASAHGRAVGRR
jgi:hypothetical protein